MNVLLLTLFISLCLSALFMVLFIDTVRSQKTSSSEHDMLLPLEDEERRVVQRKRGRSTEANQSA